MTDYLNGVQSRRLLREIRAIQAQYINRMVFWFAIAAGTALILAMSLAYGYRTSEPLSWWTTITLCFILAVSFFLAGLHAYLYSLLHNGYVDDEPEATEPDPTDAMDFAEVTPAPVRIMQTEGTTGRIAKLQLEPEQWQALARTLKRKNWRWSRSTLASVKIDDVPVFTNLTSRYAALTDDMDRVGMIDGPDGNKRVTVAGREFLRRFEVHIDEL